MRLTELVFVFSAAVTSSVFAAAPVSVAHNACKVLTAEAFGKIMGYAATTTGSTATSCFYSGPPDLGGQFMIITESAGPHADAMMKGPGSSPPPGSGMIGGMYKEGSVLFSVSIKSTDKAKLDALVVQIRRNLK